MERIIKGREKFWKGVIIFVCVLLCMYLGMSIYFINHFYFGSSINCINVSGKSVKDAEAKILAEANGYSLELEERDNVKDKINGIDINLQYNLGTKVEELKNNQNPFGWIYALFISKEYKAAEITTYDENLLKEKYNKLSCFQNDNIVEPKNPSFEYTENGYVVADEVYGNKLNTDCLYKQIVNAIVNGEKTLNLNATGCYENPQYTTKSTETINAKNILNKYAASKITYSFGEKQEVLDGSTIHNWLNIDDNYTILLDEKKVKDYVKKLANTYNTDGAIREFTTSLGTKTKVSGGDYGWIIDISKETKDLIEIIKEGQSITKEPAYMQTAISRDINDIGNTYVEINLNKQHLWYYKKGTLIVEGDVVTGNVSNGNSTPVGIYTLKFKEKNATLKGQGYSTKVDFWMPFNGGIGIHDANWRGSFGGKIYMTNGSHGCVNAPYYLANTIFNNIEEGTPIICYS